MSILKKDAKKETWTSGVGMIRYIKLEEDDGGSHRRPQDFFPGVCKFAGAARIFSGVHFSSKKVDDLFSRRPQAKTTK